MTSKTTNKFSFEVRDRAVRLVLDHESEHRSRWMAGLDDFVKLRSGDAFNHDPWAVIGQRR